MNKAFELMEEILDETSDKKAQGALDAAKQRYVQQTTLAGDHLVSNRGNTAEVKQAKAELEQAQNKYMNHVQLQAKRARRLGKKLVQDPNDHDSFHISDSFQYEEAFALMEEILDYVDNIFELDYEEKQNISPNKVSKVKRDKNGEKVEVVSVADELFPKDGDAQHQFNQKVLDKINAMIEGNGSLEDLIQFVRKGVNAKRAAHESVYAKPIELLEAFIDDLSESMHKQVSKKLKRGEITSSQAMDLDKKIETKMSPAKQFQEVIDGHEEDAKTNPKSLIREIVRTATNKSIKRARKEGKIPYPAPRYENGVQFPGDPTPERAPQTKNVVFPSRDKVEEAFSLMEQIIDVTENILNIDEEKNIFGKETGHGDLLNDVDTAVGSPVKKAIKKITDK